MKRKIGVQSIVLGINKPFKEQIEKIRKFDIDFVEVKPHYHPDIGYLGQRKGKVYFKKECMEYIKECCQDLPFQLHFGDLMFDKIRNLCMGKKEFVRFLLDVAEATNKYNDDFVLTTHLMYAKKGFQEVPVKKAIKNAKRGLKKLYKDWDFSGKLALETMMEPFVYKGAALLGYKPEQLEELIADKQDKFGICIDTGHLNPGLNDTARFKDFIYLPVYEVHFHGNHSHKKIIDDEHILPRKTTLKDYETIINYLKDYTGFVNLEVKNITDVNWLRMIIKKIR